MSALDVFVAGIGRTGLVPPDALREVLVQFDRDPETDAPTRLARLLVARGLLTSYQATKVLGGTTNGFVLGDYTILAKIGGGGMGKVYLAKRRGDNQKVALKVLPPAKQRESKNALERFQREMDLSRLVRHKYIARTLDVGSDNGVHFMAMEFVSGASLLDLVKDPSRGPLRVHDAARLFIKVCEGLAAAHDVGLVHRDIKPANIMVTPEGDARILDLGLARTIEEENALTRPNTIIGTLDYASPEQLSDAAKANARSDLYSVGCTLYFALSGRPPFEGGDVVNKIYKHRMDEAEPLERVAAGVPAEFAAIVKKLMAKEPSDRYESARDLANDLARWTDPNTTKALLGERGERARAFRPPPPRIDDADLRVLDMEGASSLDIALRDLGDAEAAPAPSKKNAPAAKAAVVLPAPTAAAQARPPAERAWITYLLIGVVLTGAVALLLIALLF
jgi:serine/threonine protein kinase